MSTVNGTSFVDRYGYHLPDNGDSEDLFDEGDSGDLCRKTEATLSLKLPLRPGTTLFFDADGTACADTYEHRIEALPSIAERLRFSLRCYTGDVLQETIEKAQSIFNEQLLVARACVTWGTDEPHSLQNIRNRARRLQTLEMEREKLQEALESGREAYERYTKNLSFFQKALFSTLSLFARTVPLGKPLEVPPLPVSFTDFADQNRVDITNAIINTKGSSELFVVPGDSRPVTIEARVLSEIDMSYLDAGTRFATLLTVNSPDTGKRVGTIAFANPCKDLIAVCSRESSVGGSHKILENIAMTVFISEPAATVHVRQERYDPKPINLRKELIQVPGSDKKVWRIDIFGSDTPAHIPYEEIPPTLPVGEDRLPDHLNRRHEEGSNIFSQVKELEFACNLLHQNMAFVEGLLHENPVQ